MSERRKFIAGNWKMNTTLPEALELVTELKRLVSRFRSVDIAVIPPALFVEPVHRRLEDSNVAVGVQNILQSGFGAFTGELSADMLKSVGATYCLAGHSERRQFYGDTNEIVNGKIKAILNAGILPIFCIGETLAQRESGQTFHVLGEQMRAGLEDISTEQLSTMVLAYEPVWAIGTGRTASPEQVGEVHSWLRNWMVENYDADTANAVRIQYGGSVKAENASELMSVPNVDGALVGGASLKAQSFAEIIKGSL